MVFALYDKVTLQDVAAPLEVFARANDFGARYEVVLVSPSGEPVGTTSFTRLAADVPLSAAPESFDTLIVPGGVPADFSFIPGTHDIPEEQTPDTCPDALAITRELLPRSCRVASICTGAFVLAALGVLDGRRATTHWAHCQRLAEEYPDVLVDADALFVQDGPVITGAGISAGTDLALAMVEADFGADVARRVARWLVVFLQRPGGQTQFSVWAAGGAPPADGLREVVDSIAQDPAADHSTASMAVRASVSERQLTRLFQEQVGMPPARYVQLARIEAAKVLLVSSGVGQESVARRAGLGSAETMRKVFQRTLGISPGAYRARFRSTGVSER